MIEGNDKTVFEEHFETCRTQLETFRDRAPQEMQPKINIAFASLTAAQNRLQGNKDLSEVLYLLGRVHWTLGFVGARRPTQTLQEIFEEEEPSESTPIVDALLNED
jgi:hypothetical protein